MAVLSASHSGFAKRVLPFLLVAGACGWTYWSKAHEGKSAPLWTLILTAGFLGAVMVFYLRRGVWSMLDSVDYSGDTITLSRWTMSETIPLAQLKSVSWEPYIVGSIVTLDLNRPGAFGIQVCFYPPDARRVPNITRDLEDFAARVRSINRG
jgi:hypothetical protein